MYVASSCLGTWSGDSLTGRDRKMSYFHKKHFAHYGWNNRWSSSSSSSWGGHKGGCH